MPNNEDEMTDLIALQKIAGWEKLKMLVLDSVSSPITNVDISPLGAIRSRLGEMGD
jgi:hypothetical protein